MTELWFRNPHNYIRELAEVGIGRIAWDRGLLVKRRIDPLKHAGIYFAGKPWRLMMIGEQGSAEYTNESGEKPVGVYPTWDASVEELTLLEEMMAYPVGEDGEACEDPNLPDDQRPVAGQTHRVVIINLPDQRSAMGRGLVRKIKELQEDYPTCVVHIHGLYSWRVCFGMGFGSVDIDPRTHAGKGKVILPSGKQMIAEQTISCPQWVTMLGMKPVDLTREPRNRCIYNIKSAVWAADHFRENIAFASRPSATTPPPNIESKKPMLVPAVDPRPFHGSKTPQANDKINCDTCSLQNSCKYYRQGSVCSVPGSEPASLATHFKTRDSEQIIEGLGTILQLQARRLDRGVADENMYGELDPEVTKIANQIFSNGVKLAKLVDPTLNGPQVQVNVGGGTSAAAVQAATPNQVIGGIVRELERRGIAREDITPDMVGNLLAEMAGAGQAPKSIEGQVLSSNG